jgi:hypothetical protein
MTAGKKQPIPTPHPAVPLLTLLLLAGGLAVLALLIFLALRYFGLV